MNTGVTLASPSGVIQWYAGATAPAGWLICDGTPIPNDNTSTVQGVVADWTNLFAVLGTTYGTDGANRKLPNLQGSFVRGWTSAPGATYSATLSSGLPGAGWNPDPSRTRGQHQLDAAVEHSHNYSDPQHNHTYENVNQSGGGFGGSGIKEVNVSTGDSYTGLDIDGITKSTDTDTAAKPKGSIEMDKVSDDETRPVNIALLPIIKI